MTVGTYFDGDEQSSFDVVLIASGDVNRHGVIHSSKSDYKLFLDTEFGAHILNSILPKRLPHFYALGIPIRHI